MWFKKKRKVVVQSVGGFSAGCLVQHKVTAKKAVIVRLFIESDEYWATVSVGWQSVDEFDTTVAEIEPFKLAPPLDAVDPVVRIATG